ncbi:MAG TPA: sigma-70 family RNA polymerase sigma factor [Acidimicrobiia bacterium]|nr:sigma-70 family RNA polymerase sigma factor [Acidimicrobiia bacterium]
MTAILLPPGACDPVVIDPSPNSDDGELVSAIAARDDGALAEAYRRHGPNCFALARRVLVDRALAEEVVQEIFIRLWNQPLRYEPARGSLRSFLVAQAHGRSVDLLRAETARRRREEKEARQRFDPVLDLGREIVNLNEGETVRDALAALPEPERVAIELAYFGGHTYREVAAMLEQPEGTVKSRIRAGLLRLRAALVEAGITES